MLRTFLSFSVTDSRQHDLLEPILKLIAFACRFPFRASNIHLNSRHATTELFLLPSSGTPDFLGFEPKRPPKTNAMPQMIIKSLSVRSSLASFHAQISGALPWNPRLVYINPPARCCGCFLHPKSRHLLRGRGIFLYMNAGYIVFRPNGQRKYSFLPGLLAGTHLNSSLTALNSLKLGFISSPISQTLAMFPQR